MVEIFKKASTLIADAKLKEAINLIIENDDLINLSTLQRNRVLQIKSRLSHLTIEKENGTILNFEYNVELNKIINHALRLVSDLKERKNLISNLESNTKGSEFYQIQLDYLIKKHKNAIQFYSISTLLILIIGLGIILSGMLFYRNDETIKIISSSGGILIMLLSGFTIREFWFRRDKVGILELLQLKIEGVTSHIELDRLDEIVWKIIEKSF